MGIPPAMLKRNDSKIGLKMKKKTNDNQNNIFKKEWVEKDAIVYFPLEDIKGLKFLMRPEFYAMVVKMIPFLNNDGHDL